MDMFPTKIVITYKNISRFIFCNLLFFVAVLIGIRIFRRIFSQASTIHVFSTSDTIQMQKDALIAQFNSFLKQHTQDNDMKIDIMLGDFQIDQGFIKSANNLITYKGFVLPRYFSIYSTTPIKPASYFSGNTYDPAELELFIDNFVFSKKISLPKSQMRIQLPIITSLIDDFNIACIFENKLSTKTCDYYINAFLDSFFIYNIATDYPGTTKIFTTLITTSKTREKACAGLSKYTLYANDQNDAIMQLLNRCGSNYGDLVKKTSSFKEIQKTLENQIFDITVYKDSTLNAYKLLSYQQQIYQDFLINKADTYKISTYLDFVKELFKKQLIDPFYIDETYRYNTYYLALTLEKLIYQSSTFTQDLGSSKLSPLILSITSLNEGEKMLGFAGLNSLIRNPSLISKEETLTGSTDIISESEKIERKLKNIYYLTIDQQSISEGSIDLIGYLKFVGKENIENIKSHILLDYKNDLFLVKSIELQNKPEMNEVIKNLLLIQNFSIGELYSYISKNLVFYEQTSSPTDLCPGLGTLKDVSIIACSPTSVILEKKSTRYAFSIKNGGIENIDISDKELENLIKASYGSIISNVFSLLDAIKSVLAYVKPVQVHEGTTNAILVFEKIQQYLGIKANDIADKNGKILVDLTLGGVDFVVNYDLSKNSLGPRYFKKILVNDKPYLIQNLNLPLDDSNQKAINAFVMDPLSAIKNADLTAWQNYTTQLKIKNQ